MSADEETAAIADGYKEIYTVTPSGFYKRHIFRGQGRFIKLKVDRIPGYVEEAPIRQEICFLPNGKIPYSLWEQVVAFFKKVIEVKKSEVEAMIHILYNAEQGYHIGVPPQTVSKASASYDWSYIPNGTSIIVDIHSHNTMAAFFSGTDERDDAHNIGFSGVVGKINDKEPEVKLRFNYYAQKYDVKLPEVFEIPQATAIDVPEDWISKVTIPAYGNGYGTHGYPVTGREVGSAVSRRSTEHLKPFQYQKGQNSNDANGNREGPALRRFQGGHELGELGGISTQVRGPLNSENQLQLPMGSYLESQFEEPTKRHLGTLAEDDPLLFDIGGVKGKHVIADDQFSLIACNNGVKVAEAFTLINDCMAELSGNQELLSEALGDMFELLDEKDQLPMLKELFEKLPYRAQQELQTSGL